MAESKEAYLDGAFYGPAIPASSFSSAAPHHPRRKFNAYALLCVAFKTFTMFLIVIGLIVLALWLIYQPESLKAYAETASLSRFDLAVFPSNSSLFYNLSLTISIRNPNKKYYVYYKSIDAEAFYAGQRLGSEAVPRFRQGRKNTTTLSLSFRGPAPVSADAVNSTYSREKSEGFFYVDVKMYLKIRLKMIIVQSVEYRPDVDCFLKIPAPGNATSAAVGFERTECKVDSLS